MRVPTIAARLEAIRRSPQPGVLARSLTRRTHGTNAPLPTVW